MRAYARFSRVSSLRLSLLYKQILMQGSSPYQEDLMTVLLNAAEWATERLEDELGFQILPWTGRRRTRMVEPHKRIQLGKPLVHVDELRQLLIEDQTGEYEYQTWSTNEYNHEDNTPAIDIGGSNVRGTWDVVGTWGFASNGRRSEDIWTEHLTATETLAGSVNMELTVAASLADGDLLIDTVGNQPMVVASSSGASVVLDQWGTPETTIAAGTSLRYCGRMLTTVERYILLSAYLDAWRRVSGLPDPSTLSAESADRHSYTKGAAGADDMLTNYATEADRMRRHILRVLKPFQPR